ncbi:putative peptidoglycan lipid II flippase [Arcanobacterium wilhelmae]|uniref:Peptidoglycan lipid II flippase n=1 Tax=Arcanobacterium wilhelmae TaxID=1803177 RepID=A0ABT9NEF3_9ACTO|nr:murein biosynthesis integral membrane protein MurJ [Arcanobacterium wilhelmae]MDP9801561.1 putative peptidoglycan lipid II flippase [Arcanobacterium wilhelmae]WFN90888.1 murein biosynthesis integral membrane protein MurJ [Arcanobacterium wilhelmae]
MAANATRSSIVMAAGTLVSRLLGFVRSPLLLGVVVGVNSMAADSFDIANKLPNLIYMAVIGGVVNAVLIPAIVRAMAQGQETGAAFINKILTLATVGLGGITFVLTLASPWLVSIFASSLPPDWYQVAVAFAFWCVPQIFFYGMYTVIGQVLNAKENFGPYMWAPALNNVVACLGITAMILVYGSATQAVTGTASVWTAGRIAFLGGVSTAGVAAQALVLLISLRKVGVRWRPDFAWRGAGIGKSARVSTWIFAEMAVGIVPTIILTNVAAQAAARGDASGIERARIAGNAGYSAAYMLYSLPQSLIVVSVVTAIFTSLARNAQAQNLAVIRRDSTRALQVIGMLMFWCTVGLVVLALPLTRLLMATVPLAQASAVSVVLVTMSLGLVGVGASTVLNRVYYAYEDTRGAFMIGLPLKLMGMIGYVLSGFLSPSLTVAGIGLTMALTNTVSVPLMLWDLRRHIGKISMWPIAWTYARYFVISVISGVFGIAVVSYLDAGAQLPLSLAVFQVLIGGTAITAMFFVLCELLRMPEVAYFERMVFAVLAKLGVKRVEPHWPRHGRK